MKNAELVLSELANRFGVKHSSKDSAEDIGIGIANHVDGLKPLELSERETGLVKQNRDGQLDMLLSEGFAIPEQVKIAKAGFVTEDLMLSEGDGPLGPADRAFDTMISVLKAGKKREPGKERSGPQDERVLALSEGDQGKKGESKLVTEMKQRKELANAAGIN